MLIKATIEENGVTRDVIINPNKCWVAIRLTVSDLLSLSQLKAGEMLILGPQKDLIDKAQVISEWAQYWPRQHYAGTHKPPEGAILMPNGQRINLDGNHK